MIGNGRVVADAPPLAVQARQVVGHQGDHVPVGLALLHLQPAGAVVDEAADLWPSTSG